MTGAATAPLPRRRRGRARALPLRGPRHGARRAPGRARAAAGGDGRVVAMVGEAGVGKSRLVREFARLAREQGALVLETATVSYGRAVGHRAGIELNRRFFQIERGDDETVAREKIAAGMRAVDRGLEDGIAAVQWLLGVPPAASPFLALDPGARRRRAVEVLVRLRGRAVRASAGGAGVRGSPVAGLRGRGGRSTTGHAHAEARAAAGHLSPRARRPVAPGAGLCPAAARAAGARRRRRRCSLRSSAPREDTGPIGRLVAERGRGNPLFLEECVRSLVDTGVLAGARGAYRVARPAATLEVPASVRAVLAARIDRLPAEQKRLLQAASVVGEDVPVPLLEAIVDLPVDARARGARRAPRRRAARRGAPSFPTRSTPSGTRSPTTWPTRACSTRAGARCTRASWRPSSGSTRVGSTIRSSASPTMPSRESSGRARCTTAARPACARSRG